MKQINFITIIGMSALLLASCGKTPKTGALTGDVTEESHAHGGEITLTEAQMKAVDIRLGRIEQRELNSVVRVNGQLTLDPQKKAEITSLVGGIIRQVLVTEGKYVSAGQAVAWLENTEIVELQKNYLTLKKESLVAEQEYNRQKELSAQGAGVEKTLQQASASHEISKAQLTGLEQQLRQISINPEQVSGGSMVTQIPVKSPIAGYVNKINISTGSYVDMQTSLMRITDNSGIHCDVKVFEKDVNRVRTGQEVDIILTNQPDIRLKGFIYDVNKSFEDDTRAVIAHIALKEKTDTELIPGMYVTGLINAGRQKTDALPNEAIVSKDGKKYIFVLEEEENGENGRICHFEQVEVITGVSELGYTQITFADKPHEDMTVVISNAFYIGSMSSDHGEHGH